MDKPTYNQIQAVFRIILWEIPREEASAATKWLEDNKSKWEVSKEIARIKALKDAHKMTKDEVFNSPIWSEYKELKKEKK